MLAHFRPLYYNESTRCRLLHSSCFLSVSMHNATIAHSEAFYNCTAGFTATVPGEDLLFLDWYHAIRSAMARVKYRDFHDADIKKYLNATIMMVTIFYYFLQTRLCRRLRPYVCRPHTVA